MDNLTHTLVGVALSRAFFKKRVAYATTALMIAANLPDLDVLYSWPGIRYIEYHRGALHSLVLLPVWALGVALALRWFAARRQQPPPALWMGFLLGLAGVGSHVLLDWSNAYGIRLFAPFSQHWYALDIAPILDPWVWLLLLAFLGFPLLLGLITTEVGVPKKNPHRLSGVLALVLLAAWLGLRARQHAAALEVLNSPDVSRYFNNQLPYDWAAFPISSSPFAWEAVVDLPANYLVADVYSPWNADQAGFALERNYIKPPRTSAIAAAEQTRTGSIFLWFARFPMADEEDQGSDSLAILTDMRFAQGVRRPAPHATVTLDGSLHVVQQRFSWSR
ncbi:MAG TPA: metal-dependent hydrolase [Terriglobales bacterium]|nr:metal-dependent hydrolase [Terriglobales bacterium]